MKIGLFIPCYIDQFYPQVGVATYELLSKLGCEVGYPLDQTCCGQPMANSGYSDLGRSCELNFVRNFRDFDYIVSPSGSCVLHVKEHLEHGPAEDRNHIRRRIYELTEFMTDILQIRSLPSFFPHRVGIHTSCHGQRGLYLCSMSERMMPSYSKPEQLLHLVEGIKLCRPDRQDECCGFGGTFCVFEEAVSVRMGKDRIREHAENEVEYITAGDISCLMHLEGILKREGSRIKIIHIAEILNSERS